MRRFSTALLALAALAAVGRGEDLDALFPRPQEVLDWAAQSDIREFSGDGIVDWKGADAQLLLDYNIEGAATAVYAGPGDASVTLEIYQLATPADAYGLLGALRPEGAEDAEVSQAAFVAGATGGLWKDVFCAIVIGEAGAETAVRDFLEVLSGRIEREGLLPDIFRAIDTVGLVPGTARYLHTDLALKKLHHVADDNVLGLAEDTEIIFGDFLIDEREFKAFIAVYPSEQAAVSAAISYAVFLGKNPDAEAAWFKQWGRAVAGIWTGLKVEETVDSEYMMFDTIKELMRQVRIFQLQK
ncbi:MAG: DUF6599 family protein [Planctomycetota bacterium]